MKYLLLLSAFLFLTGCKGGIVQFPINEEQTLLINSGESANFEVVYNIDDAIAFDCFNDNYDIAAFQVTRKGDELYEGTVNPSHYFHDGIESVCTKNIYSCYGYNSAGQIRYMDALNLYVYDELYVIDEENEDVFSCFDSEIANG